MSRRRLLLAFGALAGLWLSWSAERSSLERANRLHRAGRSVEAAELYGSRSREGASDEELRYNLGTALIETGDESAETELVLATRRGDPDLRGLAQYNTGLVRLRRALGAEVPDSVRLQAEAAAEANRATLRLAPENDDAKWNLAMSLRLLDSIDAIERRSGREMTDGAMEADVVTRSVNVPDATEEDRAEDPPAEGEQEAVALLGEEEPLSPEEAADLLGRTHRDATDLLGKLLALESRSRWGLRTRRGVRRW